MSKKTTRIAGAQLPVSTNIEFNKKEILKAIDWAKENEVKHLLTPEGSLSGYGFRWSNHLDEIHDALEEIEEHAKGLEFLHLGTHLQENEWEGKINRNEIRHYYEGSLFEITLKSYCIPNDASVPRDPDMPLAIFPIKGNNRPASAIGMICNDMWGCVEEHQYGMALNERLKGAGIDLILHATNGLKWPTNDKRQIAFDKYHDAFLRMTAFKSLSHIITVDTCTPWTWDPEKDADKIDAVDTSSESGVLDFLGWKTNVPRRGRQYFYCDIDLSQSQKEVFMNFDANQEDVYPFPMGKMNWDSYYQKRNE